MYQIREFPQAASKETLALEFRANCVETEYVQHLSDGRSSGRGEKLVTSSAFSYEFKFSDLLCFRDLWKSRRADRTQFIHCPCYMFVHFSRMKIHPVLSNTSLSDAET